MMLRLLTISFLSLLSLSAAGCQASKGANVCGPVDKLIYGFRTEPRLRKGYYASSTLGTNFPDPEDLGRHGYRYSWSEKNGIVYTCKAGHIDISHLRKSADWTAFLAAKTFEQLMKNETVFSFRFKEASVYFVKLTCPENWKDLPRKDREQIAYDISVRLGQYFTYTATTWHEILTWFGYKYTGLYSEFPSAFSWEDTFSNLLGTHIGALALRDAGHPFNEAVTLALRRELEKLDVRPSYVARRVTEKLRGLWFSGDLLFFVEIRGRNLDIGLNDGFVTPWIAPSVCECAGAEARPYPVPNLDVLCEYDFSVKFEIEPREWEKDKIMKIVYPDGKEKKRIEPAIHFAPIMDYIKKDAVERYDFDVGPYSYG